MEIIDSSNTAFKLVPAQVSHLCEVPQQNDMFDVRHRAVVSLQCILLVIAG